MTSVFPLLQKVDPERVVLEASARTCRRLGADVRWMPMPGPACYLRFSLERADAAIVCCVSLSAWFSEHWPDIEGLAWEHCGEADLRRIVSASFPPIRFDCAGLVYHRARFLERLVHTDDTDARPCVGGREGPLWIERIDDAARPPTQAMTWLSTLRLPVDYRIGIARVAMRRLAGLRIHDIVLFELAYGTAHIAQQALFRFNFSMEHIVVEDILNNFESPATDSDQAPAPGVDVAALSVSIDVVLCRMQQTLAELNDIQQGVTLPLPEGAHRSVRLMVNQQCVATGEVVQIGEHLGVQITAVMPRS